LQECLLHSPAWAYKYTHTSVLLSH